MTLRPDEWAMLESLAELKGRRWLTGTRPLEDRHRPSTVVRGLADKGLCQLAAAERVETLPAGADGVRPAWGARITRLGRAVLEYREHQAKPVEPPPVAEPAPDEVSLRGVDVDLLRNTLTAAETGAVTGIGVDIPALRTALTRARQVPGTTRYALTPAKAELAAVLHVLYLESLCRDASGYHHTLRSLPFRRSRRRTPVPR